MSSKKTFFNPLWESEFKWICRRKSTEISVFCKQCSKNIQLSNMGKRALVSHQHSAIHKKTTNSSILSFLKSSNQDETNSTELSSTSSSSISDGDEVRRAEIMWILKMVLNHFSFRSASEIGEVFEKMFPDSSIAKQFSMGYDKASYMLNFGIAPHLETILLEKLQSCGFYSVSFDKSLNKQVQQNQMDIHVRFWDEKSNRVTTHYFSSEFLGYSSAEDLKAKLLNSLQKLSLPKILQLSMDGPNVNLKL